jgi:hypothetical protein
VPQCLSAGGSGTPVVIQNPSFETPTGATAVPTCWQQGSAGTNTATWSHTSDAHTGSYAQKVTISSYTSGDRKIVQTQDSGACAPAITAGHSYQIGEWFKGTGKIAFTIFTRNAAGTSQACAAPGNPNAACSRSRSSHEEAPKHRPMTLLSRPHGAVRP